MAVVVGGGVTKYRVEALCCQMQTVLLFTPEAATREFGRMLMVLSTDKLPAEPVSKVHNIRRGKDGQQA